MQYVDKAEVMADKFLRDVRAMENLYKRDRFYLMRHLYDGYASANFGYEKFERGTILSLDEAEVLKWLADRLAKSLGLCEFDHYSLEEFYSHPMKEGEASTDRVKALKMRAVDYYHKGSKELSASAALMVAREIIQIHPTNRQTKRRSFWKQVVKELEAESAKELK